MLAALQRRLLYYPLQVSADEARRMAEDVGARAFPSAEEVQAWRFPRPEAEAALLAFHGNAGMALERRYMAETFGPHGFEVHVVEYPGYGARAGEPSEGTFFQAAEAAFDTLSAASNRPVFVLGESIGSGPACHLAQVRGDRLAGLLLVTPFERLAGPAGHHFPWLPVSLVLQDRFENDRALSDWRGRVAILVAGRDTVVPPAHGRALHAGYAGPKALFTDEEADHNDLPWFPKAPIWAQMAAFVRTP